MSFKKRLLRILFIGSGSVLPAVFLSVAAWAQPVEPGQITANASFSQLKQYESSLDRGGEVDWTGFMAGLNVARQVSAQTSLGFSLRYDYQDWSWHHLSPGATAPWTQIGSPLLGANLSYAFAPGWRFGIAPSVEWSVESGAELGDGLSYGAIASFTRSYSPDFVIGLGMGAYHEIDREKVFPYLIVRWKLSERWRLGNPLQAGPAGGAGLELAYKVSEGWEASGGGSYRSTRFRLSSTGPTPNGLGEYAVTPVFLRLSRQVDRATRFDLYAIAMLNGRLATERADGLETYHDKVQRGTALGFTLAHRF